MGLWVGIGGGHPESLAWKKGGRRALWSMWEERGMNSEA
jgi:hypothetical protein